MKIKIKLTFFVIAMIPGGIGIYLCIVKYGWDLLLILFLLQLAQSISNTKIEQNEDN